MSRRAAGTGEGLGVAEALVQGGHGLVLVQGLHQAVGQRPVGGTAGGREGGVGRGPPGPYGTRKGVGVPRWRRNSPHH